MTISELKAYIAGQLEVPVNQVAKFLNSFNKLIDELSGQGNIPFWAADLTFNTDNSGAGATCRYTDSSGTVRFWNTKVDANINNPPPNSPESTEDSYWKEASPSVAGATIFKSKPAYISTTAALPSHISTTIGGVEGCLQASVNGAFPSIDGVSLSIGQSILVRHEDGDLTIRNRVYVLTQKGSSVPLLAHKWELTPREDMRYTTAGYAHFGAVISIEKGDRNGGKFFSFLPAKSVTDGAYAWAQIPHVWPVAFNGTTLAKGDVVKAGFVKVSSAEDVPIGIVTQTFVTGAYFLLQVSGQIAESMTVTGSPSNGSIIYVSTSGALTTTETDWVFGVYTPNGIIMSIQRNFNFQKGVANGITPLGSDIKIPSIYLPSYVDDVLEGTYVNSTTFNDLTSTPYTLEAGKIYLDTTSNLSYRWSGSVLVVISSTPNDASETVKGIAELLNQTEAEAVATAGTSAGADHTRVVSGLGLWWWWAKIKTLAITWGNTFTASDLLSQNQAAASGKRNMSAIDDTGKLVKTSWAEVDETNKKITKTGLNNLSTVLEEWKNSDGTSIFQLLNDLSAKFGGTSHLLKVNAGVASGAAKFEFLNNLNLAYIFGTLGQNFIEFKSTTGDQAIRIKVRLITDYVGSVVYEIHLESTVTATAGGVTVIGSFPAAVGKIYNVRSSWAISETGGESGGASVEHTIKNAGGTTSAIGAQTATTRRSLGDWTGNIVANNTSDTIDFSFTNSSASNQKAYKVNIAAYIHETDLA